MTDYDSEYFDEQIYIHSVWKKIYKNPKHKVKLATNNTLFKIWIITFASIFFFCFNDN